MAKSTLSPEIVAAAIEGAHPLGLCAVSGTGTSRWTCVDVDDEAAFTRLLGHLAATPPPNALIERSRRGGHVFFFWYPSAPWQCAKAYGDALCQEAGIEADVFPSYGSLETVRLPGSLHPKTGRSYPALDLTTGERSDALTQLSWLTPIVCEASAPEPATQGATPMTQPAQPGEFADLVAELEQHTTVRVYAADRAIARCLWHDDAYPSLYVRGRRFSCLSSTCRVWGDVTDLRRWITKGIRPPGPKGNRP